jgi:tetratricopeptide (TPR) repeat protein
MYQEAMVLANAGDGGHAKTILGKILSARPLDPLRRRSTSLLVYCLSSLIQRYHAQGDHLRVVHLYKDNKDVLLGEENRDKGVLLLAGDSCQNLGLLEDSLTLYQHVKKTGSIAQDHVLFKIGRVLSLKGDRTAARRALEEIERTSPESAYRFRVQRLLGDFSFEQGDHIEAVKSYRRALTGDEGGPDTGVIYARLGQALRGSGQYKEAIVAYQSAIDKLWSFRDQDWARRLLGESLAEMAVYYEGRGKMSKAAECYGRIARLSPSGDQTDWALYRLGDSHRKMGNMRGMMEAFEDLDERSTNSLWTRLAHWARGDAAFEKMAEPHLDQLREAMAKVQ